MKTEYVGKEAAPVDSDRATPEMFERARKLVDREGRPRIGESDLSRPSLYFGISDYLRSRTRKRPQHQ